ncbi:MULTISPECIES: LysE family translocator [Malaciobacter]|jgi:threonine/homoserine/homoserine lactone efflux protein|uniref:LysE family translocator n=1 Tax=Malaciobacter canalis TaxID=1912871 RepID=A0ABX4LMZ8_9BACT|nr:MULTISPECIES: LysE family translocator [Malaciobacter]PHO09237.1 LysE family translocator [Malaciobacter canalis]QEE31565.1 transporter, LysE family [Malaciobacter canalis]SKB73727.1 Threonine/homoserine/homoserine lactone efflux protein [Malaciobacter marinus]
MIELSNLYMFIIASFLLCIAPGPDNIYVLTQGMTKSKKAAIITTLGLCTGLIIHTSAAAFGISMIFKTSQIAFDIVKYLGVAYLLYIAYQVYKHRNEPLNLDTKASKKDLKALYFKGFLMNILNPKVSIFFLAFLPQFVSVQNGNIPLQMIILGLIFMALTIIVFSLIGVAGNLLSEKLLNNPKIVKYMNILTSFVLISLGVKLALSQR